jgi:predicted nucleic acid-binding protein
LSAKTSARLPEVLAELDVSGGAVYDALVALAALEHDCALATLDLRAGDTYRALGVELVPIG